ncbi:WD repeat-containing protein 7 isoform X4 [Eurytemora carolleeae]|uniref:WD repeat-containing protein 7 isoform X4 n=1 Tax=Eurytemora carolleeae TaxID=1294199 RepID=UPI000C76E383|nr:WD repeat-containing protein 7 isoform X4 [Eurytemora carolleeae]|eukprot:XP_023324405.1 WD repeat-containing protein 7-like isoform X4 [Eurytemora affinis]
MASSNLVVPVVMWGRDAPSHCISSVYLMRDQRTLVTGSQDGQIIIWALDNTDTWKLNPRHMLIGHTSLVRCIAKASPGTDCHHIVSSSDNGEMSLWDTVDGQCIDSKKLNFIHTNIQAYRVPDSSVVKLFCCGFYEEVLVMDPYSLTVTFTLNSRINPDWIASFHVLRPRNRQDDVVLALTTSGTVKVWTLSGEEDKSSNNILENESKQIRCLNALSMTCCVYNMRTVLVVCATYWNVYDAGDFTCLLSVPCRRGERWIGGEFIAADRICCWSDTGHGYLYKLPTNCIVESKDFHNKTVDGQAGRPRLFCVLKPEVEENLSCPPAFKYMIFNKEGRWWKYLLRGDNKGAISVWRIPDTAECAALQLKAEKDGTADSLYPVATHSVKKSWKSIIPPPVGILDQLDQNMNQQPPDLSGDDDENSPALTSHIFLPVQCRLVLGREDGSIVLVPATQTIMMHLLRGKHHKYTSWPQHQLLLGHTGRVNCLLYPNNENPRYDVAHLISGGIDFSVCLWDIYTGSLIHRFSSHGGEVLRLYVPPPGVSHRVGYCVCGVASDHSVTLLSLKERRCILLASRQLFPVTSIKWKPLDDFMLVCCSDGSIYIWQMETGHLDRVVSGMAAQDILEACDEGSGGGAGGGGAGGGEANLANPALGLLRGIRHRNLAAIKMATQRGINKLQGPGDKEYQYQEKVRAFPLVVDGFRTNQADPEGHILFFDVEALIVQLLTEEYTVMSPGTMEVQGLTNQAEYERIRALTKVNSPDAAKKIAGFLNKVKDTADSRLQAGITASPETQKKLTGIMSKVKEGAEKAKEELEKAKREFEDRMHEDMSDKGSITEENGLRPSSLQLEINLTLEIGQLLLSLLHAWGLDKDLDKVALTKLGLLKPRFPVSFGLVSGAGGMSLVLPTWNPRRDNPNLPTLVEYFTAVGHWELSHTITTHHLLSLISVTNTLTSVSNASFVPEQERKRKLVRQATHGAMDVGNLDISFSKQQEHIKQGWSLLSTLHCVLLHDKVKQLGSARHKRIQVEILAIKWQDRCLQVRLASQELLVAELKNMGPTGRKHLVEIWSPYVPKFGDPPFQTSHNLINGTNTGASSPPPEPQHIDEEDERASSARDFRPDEDDPSAAAAKRNQTTAVILCGVIGALFDLELEKDEKKEGGIPALDTVMTRLTAKALMYLVLSPASEQLPAHTPLRRAALDLIGRGFVLWEPHLEVSKVLLGLLDMASEADKWVPSQKYALPLTPVADCCRTARHALSSIAKARAGVFITSIAKEIARYNTLASNQQTLNVNLNHHVLSRSKAEVLHVLETLINLDTTISEIKDLLTDVIDIILHCVDHNHLKQKPLQEVFPPVQTFHQVSHCLATRRIAVGTKSGSMVMYELRASKVQTIPAHQAAITALSFNTDGKNLVTYSAPENKLSFWQTSTGMFGLGQDKYLN